MPKVARRHEQKREVETKVSVPTFFVAAYVRLSVDHHDRKTESIENQKALIESFIQKYNENANRKSKLSLKAVYEDRGISGTSFSRHGFEEMMDAVRAGTINCIIVKDLSRFGRDYLDACDFLENILPFMNVRFIAISEAFDTFAEDADSKKQQVRLHNLLNELYAKDASLKIAHEKSESQKKGSFIGCKPAYGYHAEWISGIRKLVVDQEPAEIVREIFRWYDEGISCTVIADELYDMKVHRPNDYIKYKHIYQQEGENLHHWKREVVKDILRNMVYKGDLAQGKKVVSVK